MEKKIVDGLELNFTYPFTSSPGIQIIARKGKEILGVYVDEKDNFGTRLKKFHKDPNLEIPERLDFVSMKIDSGFMKSIDLDRKLMKFIYETGAEIVNWDGAGHLPLRAGIDTTPSDNATLSIKLRDVDTLALTSCITSAIKENSGLLGKNGVLLGVNEFDKIPNINLYSHRNR